MSKKTEVRPATGHINPFGLRMQPELRARLEAAATESGRSLNAEIVDRLEASFRRSIDDDEIIAKVGELSEGIERLGRDAQIAKAGAYTSSKLLAKVIDARFGPNPPPEIKRVREASLAVVELYQSAVEAIEDDEINPTRAAKEKPDA